MSDSTPPTGPTEGPAPALDVALAERYVSGRVEVADAVRVERAMERSAEWRALVGAHVDRGRLDDNLAAIHVELDAPRRGVVERAMVRMGVPEHVARLMSATPVLRRSWYLASSLVLFFALVAAGDNRPAPTVAYFLALAPVVPVLGVGLAYGPGIDPAHDMTTATPLSGLRLLLLRSAAVLLTSAAFGGVVSVLLAGEHGWRVVAWLLPSLALTGVVLLVATVVPTRVAAAITGGVWLVVVAVVARGGDELALFDGIAQVAYLGLALLAFTGVLARRQAFEITAARP